MQSLKYSAHSYIFIQVGNVVVDNRLPCFHDNGCVRVETTQTHTLEIFQNYIKRNGGKQRREDERSCDYQRV